MDTKIARFLFSSRITPQSTRGVSPAEMLMSGRLCSTMDLLLPNLNSKIRRKQLKQNLQNDTHSKWRRSFPPDDDVYIRSYSHGPKWVPAVIEELTGLVSYLVQMGDGRRMRHRVNQIRKWLATMAGSSGPEMMVEPASLHIPKQAAGVLPTETIIPTSVVGKVTESTETAQPHFPADITLDVGADLLPVLRHSERVK